MKFLAINTAASKLQVALYDEGTVTENAGTPFKKTSETLLPIIDGLFCKASITVDDIDFFACCIGPGTFTGIRIGVSTIRAMCHALGKPIVTFTNHKSLAYNVKDKTCELIVCVTDASNGFLYVAVYDKNYVQVSAPECILQSGINEFLSSLSKSYVVVCEENISFLFQNPIIEGIGAEALITAVLDEYKNNGAKDYNLAEPLYIRLSQAENDLLRK